MPCQGSLMCYEQQQKCFELLCKKKSNFAYCTVSLHFITVEYRETKKLKKVFERALRTVYNDFTSMYQNVLKRANQKMLYEEREDNIFKILL